MTKELCFFLCTVMSLMPWVWGYAGEIPDQPGVTSGIVHEKVSTGERHALAMQPHYSSRQPYSSATPLLSPPQKITENLIQDMDIYALSPHAHLLAQPRMVSPLVVQEAIQGRYQLPSQAQWQDIIEDSSKISGVDAKLIAAVIKVESNNNPQAISPRGAQGLMQLMPSTQTYLGVLDPFDPKANVQAGSLYLKEQLASFGTVELALAAYNAGPGNVHKHGGVPPFVETQSFVRQVLAAYSTLH